MPMPLNEDELLKVLDKVEGFTALYEASRIAWAQAERNEVRFNEWMDGGEMYNHPEQETVLDTAALYKRCPAASFCYELIGGLRLWDHGQIVEIAATRLANGDKWEDVKADYDKASSELVMRQLMND